MRKHFIITALFLFISLFGWDGLVATQIVPAQTVMIPMRDGKELATDLYFPPNVNPDSMEAPLPCLLIRSPAGRTSLPALNCLSHLNEGYLVAIQETRSAADPEGKTMPCIDDGWGPVQDGYDAVEWLSKSPYTNGKIGTVGPSALGISQLMVAPTNPPCLKAQYIMFACGNIFHHAAYPQGQLHKHLIESWLSYYARDPIHVATIRKNRSYSDFWAQFDSNRKAAEVRIPALFIAGWYDTFLNGSIEAFQARQQWGGAGAQGEQRLVIGPWAHFWPQVQTIGDFAVPKEGFSPPYDISSEKWFAHHLKGEKNGIENLPAVTYYVMGPFDGSPSKGNRWKSAKHWPVPAKKSSLFLTADSDLKLDKPANFSDHTFTFVYDPENPCPSLGGNNLFIESGPKDQRAIEGRPDVVVFTSSALPEDLEVTGQVAAKIFFSTDAADTDISVRLSDVYPDGRSILISDNSVRLGSLYNDVHSVAKTALSVPHEVEVKLHPTSLVFAKGHKIRLAITSSNYPRFEKNLNVRHDASGDPIGPAQKANNTIHVGAQYPSRLILPVIE